MAQNLRDSKSHFPAGLVAQAYDLSTPRQKGEGLEFKTSQGEIAKLCPQAKRIRIEGKMFSEDSFLLLTLGSPKKLLWLLIDPCLKPSEVNSIL